MNATTTNRPESKSYLAVASNMTHHVVDGETGRSLAQDSK